MCKLQQEQKLLQKSWELSRYIENCCYGDRTPNPSNLNASILYLKKKKKTNIKSTAFLFQREVQTCISVT